MIRRRLHGPASLLTALLGLACATPPATHLTQPPLPESEGARRGAAALAAGDRDAARAHFEAATAADPGDWVAHARLAKLTGRAPRERLDDPQAVLERANAHPYDPRALVSAARVLADEGRDAEAAEALETALVLASRDPSAAEEAIRLLPEVDPAWRKRRVVRVYVYADEPLRLVEGWRFRQRALWAGVTTAFTGVLGTRFVVMGLHAYETDNLEGDLRPTLAALGRRSARRREGLAAGFTSQAPTPDAPERGLAEFLGTHLVVRDVSDEETARTLAHEVAHVFGAIHMAPGVDSLLNESGDSRRVDRDNARILAAIAPRGFKPGGLDLNVTGRIDRAAAIDAYAAALRTNLAFRKQGLDALVDGRARPRDPAPGALDPHLGDVSVFVSRLLWVEGRRVDALALLDAAVRFYGAESRRGLAARERAEAWRRELGDQAS